MDATSWETRVDCNPATGHRVDAHVEGGTGIQCERRAGSGAWSPEQLMLASVGSCFQMTFFSVVAVSQVPVTSLQVSVEGRVEQHEGHVGLSEVTLRPTVVLKRREDEPRAVRALENALRTCPVVRSLKIPVRLETKVVHDSTQASTGVPASASP